MEQTYQNILDELLLSVIQNNASDIHIMTDRRPYMRVEGQLSEMATFSECSAEMVAGFLKIMAPENILKKLVDHQEIDFAYQFKDNLRLRGNASISLGRIGIVLRTISPIKSFETLKLPEDLTAFATAKQGFFLVVGPVGQGKSTTLAAMIDMINRERSEHIVTIESPIEYMHTAKKSLIDQREVGIDTVSFDSALHAAFRQDVNVLLIGEMRDRETIAAAVTAAETGHLVFATLHTNSASQTIDRIIDSFPPEQQNQVRMQLSGSLLGIFSQRLIQGKQGGRVPAYELLYNTRAVANTIREGRTHEIDMLIETGSEHGMVSMNQSLIRLVRNGEITIDDARHHSQNTAALDQLLGTNI